jgi:adsorption protein B
MIRVVDAIAHEAMLFAAIGLLIGGLDDLLVDLVYWVRRGFGRDRVLQIDRLPARERPRPLAVFVPAWDEAPVIGAMLATALQRFRHPDYRLYVGLYPNDGATIAAVEEVARRDPRVRPVVGTRAGPTTKADCLNLLWHVLRAEAPEVRAVVLHDAEDFVHPDELTVFDALLDGHAVVQLPVLPLIARGSIVSAVYADEFAEAHAKAMVVRVALGAGMPLAGTGCALRTDMLEAIARSRNGDPFDADSLTEDYELGIRAAALGQRSAFARVTDARGDLVAVRAFFPVTIRAAVRQKARWMVGIAFAGWDRVGWGRAGAIGDHWMRARDRRAPLAVVVLAVAYLTMPMWLASMAWHGFAGTPAPEAGAGLSAVLAVNGALLIWRLVSRYLFTTRVYGVREGLLSAPRLVVGNIVALMAARRAVVRYVAMLAGARPVWDKTTHIFPEAGALDPQ